ncbi:MAG: hypothetical protein K0Q79_2298 [Flavipsychrobacter sp.]|nr:hypothetical protein [Flavipsychrobacter sp.]
MIRIVFVATFLTLFGCESGTKTDTQKDPVQNDTEKDEENDVAKANKKSVVFPLPDGFVGRGNPDEYVVYSDSVERRDGRNVSTIRSIKPVNFATIISSIKPKKCIGKRISYTAWVKARDVTGWAGLWLRIDPKDPYSEECLGFDNMSGRPIHGTSDWAIYEIVLDVPEGADQLVYGALLDGDGQVWVDSMEIKIVDKKTPLTDRQRRLPKIL